MKKAVIAIGSNSTRMLTAQCGEILTQRYTGRVETRLFMGLDENGALRREAMESTAEAVFRLKREAETEGAEKIDLIATSATREASNADAFALLLKEKTGLRLQVIPGEEEAAYAFRAAAGTGSCVLTDIGGGSTEFSLGKGGNLICACSTRTGASRLLKHGGINSREDMNKTLKEAEEALRPAAEKIGSFFRPDEMIGIGGTCTTAASIALGRYSGGEAAEGFCIELREAERQLEMLAEMSPDQRRHVPGLPETRILHMPHGLCILIASMRLLGFDRLRVSGRTITDGWLLIHGGETQ